MTLDQPAALHPRTRLLSNQRIPHAAHPIGGCGNWFNHDFFFCDTAILPNTEHPSLRIPYRMARCLALSDDDAAKVFSNHTHTEVPPRVPRGIHPR